MEITPVIIYLRCVRSSGVGLAWITRKSLQIFSHRPLHPVDVESVAWITETKNTESGLFFLLSILFSIRWQ
jgi:hypothetical protein